MGGSQRPGHPEAVRRAALGTEVKGGKPEHMTVPAAREGTDSTLVLGSLREGRQAVQ